MKKKNHDFPLYSQTDSPVPLLSDIADTEDSIIWVFVCPLKFIISEPTEERKIVYYISFLARNKAMVRSN